MSCRLQVSIDNDYKLRIHVRTLPTLRIILTSGSATLRAPMAPRWSITPSPTWTWTSARSRSPATSSWPSSSIQRRRHWPSLGFRYNQDDRGYWWQMTLLSLFVRFQQGTPSTPPRTFSTPTTTCRAPGGPCWQTARSMRESFWETTRCSDLHLRSKTDDC